MQTCGFFCLMVCFSPHGGCNGNDRGRLKPYKAEVTEEGAQEWRAGEREGEILEARELQKG